jgi:hypothetical protein
VLEIVIEPRRTHVLKTAVAEAIEGGDYDGLYDDVRDVFTEDQIERIEDALESGDMGEALEEIVSEWGGEDVDELLEAIETYFAEHAIDVQFEEDDAIVDVEVESETFDDDEDFDDKDDFVDEEDDDFEEEEENDEEEDEDEMSDEEDDY